MNKTFIAKSIDNLLLFALLFLCLAIYLPIFFKSLAITIFALSLLTAYCSKSYSLKENFAVNKFLLPLIALYLFYVIGLLWSKDMDYGLFDLQVKLPLLLLPLLFFFLPKKLLSQKTFWLCALALIGGMIITIFYDLTAGVIRAINGNVDIISEITYSSLSPNPLYIAVYNLIALILIYKMPLSKLLPLLRVKQEINIKTIVCIILGLFAVLLESRSGFISLLLACLWIVGDMFFVCKRKKQAIVALCTIIIAVTGALNIPFIKNRYYNATVQELQTINKSNEIQMRKSGRTFIYSHANKLISQSPIVGVGTGDTKQALKNFYQNEQVNFDFYLNAHNQFLQTMIALGFVGLCILLSAFVYPLKAMIKKKAYFMIAILCMIGLGFMFESMLERNIGTYFFALIYSLLMAFLPLETQKGISFCKTK